MDTQHTDIPKKTLSIALIDNEEPINAAMRSLLEAIGGYSLTYFQSPEDFLESTRPENFDCILLDYMFPGEMDGMEMLRRLEKLGNPAPVVMVTSKDKADHLDTFEMGRLGAKALLLKPFVAAQLRSALRKAMLPVASQPTRAIPSASAKPALNVWEAGDLEELNPTQLDPGGLSALRARARTKLSPDESGKLASLTLSQMKVFLLRAQHDKTDRELSGIYGGGFY
jgi:DNA-binding response OmpR family regulator